MTVVWLVLRYDDEVRLREIRQRQDTRQLGMMADLESWIPYRRRAHEPRVDEHDKGARKLVFGAIWRNRWFEGEKKGRVTVQVLDRQRHVDSMNGELSQEREREKTAL